MNFNTTWLKNAQKKTNKQTKAKHESWCLRLFGSSSDEVEKMLLRPFFLSSNNRQYTFFYVWLSRLQ